MTIDLFIIVTYGKQHEEEDIDHQLLQSGPDLELLVVRLQGETRRPHSYRTRKIHIRSTEQVDTIRHRTRQTELQNETNRTLEQGTNSYRRDTETELQNETNSNQTYRTSHTVLQNVTHKQFSSYEIHRTKAKEQWCNFVIGNMKLTF